MRCEKDVKKGVSTMKPKVIIAEGGPSGNVGSMALMENSIKIAKQKHSNCEIVLLCATPEDVDYTLYKDNLHDGVKVMGDLFLFPTASSVNKMIWLILTILWIAYTRILLMLTSNISWGLFGRRKKIIQEVENADFIYCIGAERINDIYYKTALLSLVALDTYCRMGKKIIHLSLTIGPVFYKSTIHFAKKVLNKSFAIYVRDKKSFEILKEWHCTAPYQFNSFDIALLQSTICNDEDSETLIRSLGISPNFIAVSVIDWSFRKAVGPARMPEYNRVHAQILDYIIEKYDKDIVFTPTVVGGGYKVSDSTAAESVLSLMKNKNRVVSILRLLTPMELASVYKRCYFGIVTRMHAAILCSGAGHRPVIAVNYLYKLREYMKNIGFEDYSIDIDFINFDDLKRIVDKMFLEYDLNKERLNNRVLEMQKQLCLDLEKIN